MCLVQSGATDAAAMEDGDMIRLLYAVVYKLQDSLLNLSNERTLSYGQYKIIKTVITSRQSQTNMPHIHTGSGSGDKVTPFSQL